MRQKADMMLVVGTSRWLATTMPMNLCTTKYRHTLIDLNTPKRPVIEIDNLSYLEGVLIDTITQNIIENCNDDEQVIREYIERLGNGTVQGYAKMTERFLKMHAQNYFEIVKDESEGG